MFAKANWAIFGLNKESHQKFHDGLNNRAVMFLVSQLCAAQAAQRLEIDTVGINPYLTPRMDDISPIPDSLHELVFRTLDRIQVAIKDNPDELPVVPDFLSESELELQGYGRSAEQFSLTDNSTVNKYGFWCVLNEWKDANHVKSLREQAAYDTYDRPYAFLSADQTKELETKVKVVTNRKQFPVIVDYDAGRVYVAETNKTLLNHVRDLLTTIGATVNTIAWKFPSVATHWPSTVLNNLYKESGYTDAYQKRAYEVRMLAAEEHEIIDDAVLHGVVHNTFSTTNNLFDFWASLTTPAQLRISPKDDVVAVRSVTNATTLLTASESSIFSASVVMQEEITTIKNEVEKKFRRDYITFDLNDKINIVDVGAAALPGFNLPDFCKVLKKEIRKSKTVPPIGEFWSRWAGGMDSAVVEITFLFRNALGLHASDEEGGLLEVAVIPKGEGEEFETPTPAVVQ